MASVSMTRTTLAERRRLAQQHAGLSDRQAFGLLKWKGKTGCWEQFEATASEFPADVVAVAELFHVDPRWLALGDTSPAGASALLLLDRSWRQGRLSCLTAANDRAAIVAILGTTPEPDKGPGVCRYCFCTDDAGCGDCTWVDRAATICSACLLPAEA